MELKKPIELAQLIVRGSYINFNYKEDFNKISSIYKFSNENISEYFHYLKNREKILTVIGSGGQILNSILAGTRNIDCFDISIFPEYYLYLQIASILALSKEEYLEYYLGENKDMLFSNEIYEKISKNLKGKYKEFWDALYDYNEGLDIYNSLLFKYDLCPEKTVIENNPYLHENNYEKLKHILKTENIKINASIKDIIKVKIKKEYDLINLSNILTYYFKNLEEYIKFLESNFYLTEEGIIINYFFNMRPEIESKANNLLYPKGYVEDIKNAKVLVYKK